MIWHRSGSSWWVSDCSRYEVRKVRWPEGINGQVYFYGRICHTHMVDSFGDEIPTSIRQWCEEHRRRVLPQVITFETWIADRYGADFQRIALGPYGRRDAVRDLITRRGEWQLPLRNQDTGHTLTLGEIYVDLYQNGTPDHSAPTLHENGDGV